MALIPRKFAVTGCTLLLLAGASGAVHANKSLASTLNIYVFPTAGQTETKQSADEAECYNWAVNSSGVDPFEVNKQSQQQAANPQAGQAAGVRGGVRGAAVGALIGEIADDDAGKGAAYGAVLGTMRGRRQGREQRAQAQQKAQSQQQANSMKMDNFKRAFAVCLEAKKYLVK